MKQQRNHRGAKVRYDPARSYMFKVSNRNTRTKIETCSKLIFNFG